MLPLHIYACHEYCITQFAFISSYIHPNEKPASSMMCYHISEVHLGVNILCPHTLYLKKYAHGFCFAVLCCGYTLTDFPISIRLTSLALWQSNDCPSASKASLMNMDKYFMWIHYERLHNHNKAKHNKTVCIFLGIYCSCVGVHQETDKATLVRHIKLLLLFMWLHTHFLHFEDQRKGSRRFFTDHSILIYIWL